MNLDGAGGVSLYIFWKTRFTNSGSAVRPTRKYSIFTVSWFRRTFYTDHDSLHFRRYPEPAEGSSGDDQDADHLPFECDNDFDRELIYALIDDTSQEATLTVSQINFSPLLSENIILRKGSRVTLFFENFVICHHIHKIKKQKNKVSDPDTQKTEIYP